ncbi:DUF6602 domain-containing protein [Flavobacterium sp. HJSW_4]|uniref:DUF6602 domain-containing protein n=1 Tax=Flavobacterium sp. HJSW_4 TaxID=3344660 RepID=UPI0035F39734
MSVILDAIKENLRHIKIIFEPTESSFTKDTKKTGDAKELSVKQFIESFFPQSFQIQKGLIYSIDDNSQEIDCVLLAPNHPRLVTPVRNIILAEGVHAAIEVKPDISTLTESSEFHRALKQIASVKKLKRNIHLMPTGYTPTDHSIPSIIFSNKSQSLEKISNYLLQQVNKGIFKPTDLPDLIFTIDHGIIFHSAYASECLFKDYINSQIKLEKNNIFLEIPANEMSLPLFIYLLYCFTPPEPFLSEPMIKKYLTSISFPSIIMRQY